MNLLMTLFLFSIYIIDIYLYFFTTVISWEVYLGNLNIFKIPFNMNNTFHHIIIWFGVWRALRDYSTLKSNAEIPSLACLTDSHSNF